MPGRLRTFFAPVDKSLASLAAALHLILIGYLAYKSGYVPRVIGVPLDIAGGGYLIDSFGGLLIENYSITVASFSFIGEAMLMLWLLVKGRTITLNA